MPFAGPHPPAPLDGCIVLVVDATTGAGRIVTARLCAAGAAVAVVGAGHPGRGDDAATKAAFLCKELADIDRVALPYRTDIDDLDMVRELPAQIASDLGPVSASVVVIPSGPGTDRLAERFRAASRVIAAALPEGARHIELASDTAAGAGQDEELVRRVVEQLLSGADCPPDALPSAGPPVTAH
ncbi:hypothetical protein [Streptomyces sp. MS2.AVA.5]|uniref:Uncharacterized protein n=1 Tax=Streptomyces achmelvichensis TaxID=3134111 RepID=A0ACC6PY28_9ACTN